jgi:single-stranded DNA-binding protein
MNNICNNGTVIGYVGKVSIGNNVGYLSIGINDYYKGIERTTWANFKVFNALIPVVNQYCTVGRLIGVSYYLTNSKGPNEQFPHTDLVVSGIKFLTAPKSTQEQSDKSFDSYNDNGGFDEHGDYQTEPAPTKSKARNQTKKASAKA